MTAEKALEILNGNKDVWRELGYESIREFNKDWDIAFNMAIKALEQTRPKGKWSRPSVVAMPYSFAYECPICRQWGNIQTFEPNYCPNCGAKMEVEE